MSPSMQPGLEAPPKIAPPPPTEGVMGPQTPPVDVSSTQIVPLKSTGGVSTINLESLPAPRFGQRIESDKRTPDIPMQTSDGGATLSVKILPSARFGQSRMGAEKRTPEISMVTSDMDGTGSEDENAMMVDKGERSFADLCIENRTSIGKGKREVSSEVEIIDNHHQSTLADASSDIQEIGPPEEEGMDAPDLKDDAARKRARRTSRLQSLEVNEEPCTYGPRVSMISVGSPGIDFMTGKAG